MAKLTVYMVLLFSISVTLYLMGAQSPFLEMLDSVDPSLPAAERITTALAQAFTDGGLLAKVGLASGVVVIGAAALGGGSSVFLFGIPLLLFVVSLNIFILPTDILFQQSMPQEISWIVFMFINILLFLAALEFTRGGAT